MERDFYNLDPLRKSEFARIAKTADSLWITVLPGQKQGHMFAAVRDERSDSLIVWDTKNSPVKSYTTNQLYDYISSNFEGNPIYSGTLFKFRNKL